MTLTADQYHQVSQGYPLAAADPFIPPDRRRLSPKGRNGLSFLGDGKVGRSARMEMLIGSTAIWQLALWLASLVIQNRPDDQ